MGGAAAAAAAGGAAAMAAGIGGTAARLPGASGAHEAPHDADGRCDTAWLALCAIARLHHVAADPDHLAHALGMAPGEPVGVDDLLRAARHLGLCARAIRTRAERLSRTPLPALAVMATDDGPGVDVCLLAQCDGSRVLLSAPRPAARGADHAGHAGVGIGQAGPRIEPLEAFAARWSGQLILVTSRAASDRKSVV